MKKILLPIALLLGLFFGKITTISALNTQSNSVTLTVLLCDTTQGYGDYFAEIYGTDLSGTIRDYSAQQDSATFAFQDVADGTYEIAVYREGFKLYKNENVVIHADYQQTLTLQKNMLPPENFIVDTKTLIAQWDAPQIILLHEDFEDTLFPPENWQNVEFTRGNDTLFPEIDSWPSYFAVEPVHHSKSSTAELITPPVDLRQASHFKLSFDYFFKAQYGEMATVLVSFDNGTSWQTLNTLSSSPSWSHTSINLDNYSGVGGKRSAQFKFSFPYAQGFYDPAAVDNIEIKSEIPLPDSYTLFLDNQTIAQLLGTVLSDTLTCLAYGEQHQASIFAGYGCGYSDTVSLNFTSQYLPMVQKPFFTYTYGDASVAFQLQAVDTCDSNWQYQGLLHFNIFLDGDSILTIPYIPGQGGIVYASHTPGIGAHCYCASAVYDLGYWGLPGQIDESAISCDTVFVAYGETIPFTEDWGSGDFELNRWNADASIAITSDDGTPSPAAMFSPPQNGQPYQQFLASDNLLTDRFKVGAVWFDFDLKSEDTAANPSQSFIPEIRNANATWSPLEMIATTMNNEWEPKHYDISGVVSEDVSAVRFELQGDGSNPLRKWYVDNIHLYRTCQAPDALNADYIWDGTFGIRVRWHFLKSSNPNENRGLTGYNIYRKSDSMSDYELYDFVPFTNQGEIVYKDMYPAVDPHTGYFYKVCAMYADANDSLESAFAHAINQPDNDYVYVFVTGQKENSLDKQVRVYPNPARKEALVSAPFVIDNVVLFNNKGEEITSYHHLNSKKIHLHTLPLSPGIYFLKIQGNGQTVSKKILVQ